MPSGLYATFGCQELPQFNSAGTFHYGSKVEADSAALLGDKGKVIFTLTADNHLECVAETETYGTIKWTEDYTVPTRG